jgi:hypothetical protein
MYNSAYRSQYCSAYKFVRRFLKADVGENEGASPTIGRGVGSSSEPWEVQLDGHGCSSPSASSLRTHWASGQSPRSHPRRSLDRSQSVVRETPSHASRKATNGWMATKSRTTASERTSPQPRTRRRFSAQEMPPRTCPSWERWEERLMKRVDRYVLSGGLVSSRPASDDDVPVARRGVAQDRSADRVAGGSSSSPLSRCRSRMGPRESTSSAYVDPRHRLHTLPCT